ncbi:hypothetical protein T08_8897 [Trichinella sp. T8]|nr:hypothetical protein T08_8897 [Trichinella sp. T8]
MALQFIIALNSPALASQPIAKLATWIIDLVGIEFFPVTRDEVGHSQSERLRSYHVESTASRPICEVKQRWADVSTRIGDGLGTRSVVDFFHQLCHKLIFHAVEWEMVLGSCSTFKVIALLGFIWLELLWQSSDQIEIENIKSSTRTIFGYKRIVDSFSKCLRSYHVESTASRPICEVKQRWADVSTRIGDGLGTRSVVDFFHQLCHKLIFHAVEWEMVLGSCSTFKVIALLGFIWLELLWQSSDQIEIENIKSSTRTIFGYKRIVDSFSKCLRSYHVESTASRPICEVKQRWADVSTRIGDGLGTRSVVDFFHQLVCNHGIAVRRRGGFMFSASLPLSCRLFFRYALCRYHSRIHNEYEEYDSVNIRNQQPISFCSLSTTVLPEIQVLRFCLCPLNYNALRNVPLNPGFYHLQILLSVWSSLFDSVSVSSSLLSSSSDRKSCTPTTEMAVTNETSCGLLFVERLLMIDQLVGTTRLPQGESPPGQSALAVTMDYTTADPRHSRIDGNAVGMLQVSVYRQRFVRSSQSAENEPKDAEQTEEELHPVERIVKYSPRIAKTSTGEDRRATQVKYAKSTIRPRVTPVSTQFYSPLLGAGYLRCRGGARYLRRRPKSPSASSKPPGFGSFHLRLVRGAGGQLAIPLRRLLLQGHRLTFRRSMIAQAATGSPDPEPGSPDAAIAIYSTLRAHCSCPSPHLMSTGSWMCHR